MVSAEKRMAYGTCENQKTDGDAEAAAREGGDEAAGAQTGAEVRAVSSAIFKTSQYEVSSAQPLKSSQFTNVMLRDPVPLAI